jgi:hypothetical protein
MFLCVCETWPFDLRQEHRFRGSENKKVDSEVHTASIFKAEVGITTQNTNIHAFTALRNSYHTTQEKIFLCPLPSHLNVVFSVRFSKCHASITANNYLIRSGHFKPTPWRYALRKNYDCYCYEVVSQKVCHTLRQFRIYSLFPIWVLINPDSSTRALRKLSVETPRSEAGETLQEVAENFAYEVSLFILVWFFNMP